MVLCVVDGDGRLGWGVSEGGGGVGWWGLGAALLGLLLKVGVGAAGRGLADEPLIRTTKDEWERERWGMGVERAVRVEHGKEDEVEMKDESRDSVVEEDMVKSSLLCSGLS